MRLCRLFLIICFLLPVLNGHAQTAQAPEKSREDLENPSALVPSPTQKNPVEVSVKKKEGHEWVFAPVPGYNPSQGWTLALTVQNIFKQDEKSQPSILAGAVVGTEKKSIGGALGYLGRLNEDKLKISAAAGYGKMNSDFYGIGKYPSSKDKSVLLEQTAGFFAAQVMPKIGPIYAGINLVYVNLKNKFDIPAAPPDITPGSRLDDDFWTPGLNVQWDTRDNYLYPTEGYLTELVVQFHDEDLSGHYTFQRYRVDGNAFYSLFERTVLALRLHFDFVEGNAPFYCLPSFGQGGDLRGYKTGKYIDNAVWATQLELRQRFSDKWGGVVFGGVGDVLDSISNITLNDNLLSSGGVGLRYQIASDNPMDFRVDMAYGDDEWSWYFSIGQAF